MRKVAVLIAVLGLGCTSTEVAVAPSISVVDSAGVQIISSDYHEESVWRVGSEPEYVTGWAAGGPEFSWIRSGAFTADGGAWVGDSGLAVLYRLGRDGSLEMALGGRGEGPGELQGIEGIASTGDTVVVSDLQLGRLTWFHEGEVVSTRALGPLNLRKVGGVYQDSRVLLVAADAYGMPSEVRQGWAFEDQAVVTVHPNDDRIDTLAVLPRLKRWYGTRAASPGALWIQGLAAHTPTGFAWSRSDIPEVRWYDHSGELLQIARWSEPLEEVDSDYVSSLVERRRYLLSMLDLPEPQIGGMIRDLRAGLARHEGPVPLWDGLLSDDEGNIWLREFAGGLESSDRWRVIGADGGFVGWVEFPESVRVLDVADDRVLGVNLNEFDVPAVVVLPLVKSR